MTNLEVKARLLQAAAAAYKIAASGEDIDYTPEEYAQVLHAFASLPGDVRRLIAENDMYRAMYDKDLSDFLMEEKPDGRDVRPEDSSAVGGSEEQASEGPSPEQRPADERTEGVLATDRPVRKRTRRSKPRSNKGESKTDSE